MYVAIVFDALTGPPRVVTQIRSNTWRAPIIDRKTETRIVGPRSGRVIRRIACQRLAPSIAAASSSSRGMPWRPASRMIMWNPKYFHEMMTNIVSITIDGSASQPCDKLAEADAVERPIEQPVRQQDELEDDRR